MTATPAPGDLESQFSQILKCHEDLGPATTLLNEQMRAVIAGLKAYSFNKVMVNSSTEVDYGLVAELIIELETVVKLD